MTTVEVLEAANDALSGLGLDDLRDQLHARAERLQEALRGRGGPVLAAVRRLNAPPTRGSLWTTPAQPGHVAIKVDESVTADDVRAALAAVAPRAAAFAGRPVPVQLTGQDAEWMVNHLKRALERIGATEGEGSERGCHGCGRGVDDCDADDTCDSLHDECHGRIARAALRTTEGASERQHGPVPVRRAWEGDMSESLIGRENPYTCEACGKVTNTIHADDGVTPFMLNCRATPDCKGLAVSAIYPAHIPAPTWEWYRPASKELPTLKDWEADHVAQGGALIRPVSDATRARFPGAFA